ncbi:MAG: hypothetical protein R3191_02775 [Anaerolineales bacterium]|nr:hypothetical protein [Anaerolineales bacterium]
MITQSKLALPFAALALLAASIACGLPEATSEQVGAAATQTLDALATRVAATQAAGQESPTTETSASEPSPTAPPEAPTATATVVHQTRPGSPGSVHSFITDRSSRGTSAEGRTIGDNFDILLFERPFAAQGMQYRAYLDITRAEISSTGAWFYVTISLEGAPPSDANPHYGVEIDIDKDGRGDWLIYAASPPGADWTAVGVRALRDTNNDVGGQRPLRSEDPPASGDGYDELVFDSGHGADPDAAWIRQSPAGQPAVQIAFKQTLIGPPGEFLWGVWADEGLVDPAQFDYNDRFTIAQAGSPVSTTNYYPLNELELLDNSCRWGYGFTPTSSDPGACQIPPTPTPTSPPATPTFTPTATLEPPL